MQAELTMGGVAMFADVGGGLYWGRLPIMPNLF